MQTFLLACCCALLLCGRALGLSSGSKGGGSKGFGAPKAAPASSPNKPLLKNNKSPMGSKIGQPVDQGVDQGRQQMEAEIQSSIDTQPGMREWMLLDADVESWESTLSRRSVVDRATIPQRVIDDQARKAGRRAELASQHGLEREGVRARLQTFTWDCAASSRTARHNEMAVSPAVEQHLLDTCAWVLKRPSPPTNATSSAAPSSVLDVGCGNGVILRWLLTHPSAPTAGVDYTGIDLSGNMIMEAQRQYTTRAPHSLRFLQANFLSYAPASSASSTASQDDARPHSAVLFNECLHNFAAPAEALARACSLVTEGGRVVVAHPRGWANVQGQKAANAWLSPSLLPTANELIQMSREIGGGRRVEVEVAPEVRGGYLAVLKVGGG